MEYHVSVSGNDFKGGTREKPFRTISHAAQIAMPGDTVTVHEGVYREWVKPENSGLGEQSRIVYRAAPGEKVVIKGSERVACWENAGGTVWKAVLPNEMFGDYNPYRETIGGDWFIYPTDRVLHTGEVYFNGKAFFETGSPEEVRAANMRTEGYSWDRKLQPIPHPEDTKYQWCCVTDEKNTTIYANFQGEDPNCGLTEINVRRSCFYPVRTGRNYITVSGFEMAQAACPWAPPTADQPGLLGVNWSRGWIIENNDIHDAKCSGISIGKEESTGQNMCTRTRRKPGYQYQMEAVFRALRIGWSRGTIGSHIIRNNKIHDCGQNGIVGHMGGVFSEISGNNIYNIAVRHEFFGYEIAGIKLHAAIDVRIIHNCIHDCELGTWLDWQAQGTRVSRNVYFGNERDLMVEVSHGPYLVDSNIFGSGINFVNVSQGGAYLHNLCCGIMLRFPCLDRATPYHFAHSTEAAGAAVVYSGDDRWYQNIFTGTDQTLQKNRSCGTSSYDGCPVSLEEYTDRVLSYGVGDLENFVKEKQPAYIDGNCYFPGAHAFDRETENCFPQSGSAVRVQAEDSSVWLEMDFEQWPLPMKTRLLTTEALGTTRITEEGYENPDGTPIVFKEDICGEKRPAAPSAGPVQNLRKGKNRVKVWG